MLPVRYDSSLVSQAKLMNSPVGRNPIPYDMLWPVKKPPGAVFGKVVETKDSNSELPNVKVNGSTTGLGLGPIQCKYILEGSCIN